MLVGKSIELIEELVDAKSLVCPSWLGLSSLKDELVRPIDDSTLVIQLENHGTEFGSHLQR